MPVRSENAIQISGTRTPSRSRATICTCGAPPAPGAADSSRSPARRSPLALVLRLRRGAGGAPLVLEPPLADPLHDGALRDLELLHHGGALPPVAPERE